jgi:hypothetical protein
MDGRKLSVLVFAMFLSIVGGVNASEGLVSYWNFDEGSGTVAGDSTSTNDGTIYDATWTDGVCGKALSFDGDRDYVIIGDYEPGTITGAITITAWVKADVMEPSIHRHIISLDPTRALIKFYDNQVQGRVINTLYPSPESEVWVYDPNNAVSVGNWHHLAITYDKDASGEQLKLYTNGDLSDSATITGDLMTGDRLDNDIVIGTHTDTWRPNYGLIGTIDEVAFFNSALSADEISALYQNPCGGDANKGHGNDPDGVDEDNPGKGCENKNGNRKRC